MKAAGGLFPPVHVARGHREGVAIYADSLLQWEIEGGYIASLIGDPAYDRDVKAKGNGLMTLERTLESATVETEEAYARFDKARTKFRAEIKNEVASVEAAAKKIAAEFERVQRALIAIQQTYTSGAFVEAVANAERLAVALTQIQALSSSRLLFTVIEQKPAVKTQEQT